MLEQVKVNYLWWQTGVIYQIYPRSFKDTTNNGVGDLNGIIEKLDYLSETLGVDCLWLSPFYPSPQVDFGYDVADFTNVDPLFGTLADFDRLVQASHQRGLKLIIDFVPNHSSDQHPWFIESRSSKDNPKRDWYIWKDAKPDGSVPNNWLSVFGGPAWTWEEETGQYYLHSFLKEQPDLNWRNPEVEAAMFDAMRFWLDRGIDGFRIDVAHFIMKDPDFRDNPIENKPMHRPMGEYTSQDHIHDIGHEDIHEAFRKIRRLLNEYSQTSERMCVAEIHEFNLEKWASYYGDNLDELHMPFNFLTLTKPWKAYAIRDVVESLENVLPEGAWPNYVLGNHDENRIVSRYGKAQARVAAMLLLTLRGTPTLYYGDEIGMPSAEFAQSLDPWGQNLEEAGRDGCRTPMQWDAGPNAGFTEESVTPWLPISNDVHVNDQVSEPASMLRLYQRLLAFRKTASALQWGSYQTVGNVPEDCFAYLRETENQRILVLLSFSDEQQNLHLESLGTGHLLLSTHLNKDHNVDLADITLRPHEGLLIELG